MNSFKHNAIQSRISRSWELNLFKLNTTSFAWLLHSILEENFHDNFCSDQPCNNIQQLIIKQNQHTNKQKPLSDISSKVWNIMPPLSLRDSKTGYFFIKILTNLMKVGPNRWDIKQNWTNKSFSFMCIMSYHCNKVNESTPELKAKWSSIYANQILLRNG